LVLGRAHIRLANIVEALTYQSWNLRNRNLFYAGVKMRAHYKIFMIDQDKIFKTIIDLVTIIVLYILILALLAGVLNILQDIRSILFGTLGGGFGQIVSSVLTIFVLIDLFKTFVDYREHEEIRLTYVTDATILIVMREIAVGVYDQRFDYQFILGLSTLLLILGITRALAVKYPPNHDF
jgi:uncharacterized membrane protein (DUF373 family)